MTKTNAQGGLLQDHQDKKVDRLLTKEVDRWSEHKDAEKDLDEDKVYKYEKANGRETRPTPLAVYVLTLGGIGYMEWLINYKSFLAFFGVQAFALGSTIVVAIMVAIASHVHGTLLKQPIRRQELRLHGNLSDTGYFVAVLGASTGLLLVFVFVVGVRYLAWRDLTAIGVELSVWPKVMTTLLMNVVVWLIGSAAAIIFHSKGQYTKRQGKRDAAFKRFKKASQAMMKYQGNLQVGRSPEEAKEVNAYIEQKRQTRREEQDATHRKEKGSSLTTIFLVAIALLCFQSASAQFSSEYDIAQFCSDANVAASSPLRRTVVYVDETVAMPPNFALDDAEDNEGAQRALASALGTLDWYAQMEAKLTASLMPSEHVAVVLVRRSGVAESVAELCWPGYSEGQLREIAERGFWENFTSTNPVDDLPTQRNVAFALVRGALAKGLTAGVPSPEGRGRNYVRALSRDEGRLRSDRGRFVRALFFGEMAEDSEYGAVLEEDSPATLARRAVERTSLRLGGASFYIYGPHDFSDNVRDFYTELLRRGGGQLAALGSDLALVAKVPAAMHRFALEVEAPPPERVRRGIATVLVAEGGEIVDGAVVLAGTFRAALVGNLTCSERGPACSSCELRAETTRSVYFKSLPHETLALAGTGGSLEGYIGEGDSGQPSRAYGKVSARTEGCE